MSGGDNQNDDFGQFDDGAFESLDGFSAQEPDAVDEPLAADMAAPISPEAVAGHAPTPRSDGEKKTGTKGALAGMSPYTVMLGLSLAAILVSIFILWSEWASYGYDRNANEAKNIRISQVEMPEAELWV